MMNQICLIALDLDGTLLDSEKHLSEENRRALEQCARLGIHIVPATGRAVDGILGSFGIFRVSAMLSLRTEAQ